MEGVYILYTERLRSRGGISCRHWLIWLLCGEPLDSLTDDSDTGLLGESISLTQSVKKLSNDKHIITFVHNNQIMNPDKCICTQTYTNILS